MARMMIRSTSCLGIGGAKRSQVIALARHPPGPLGYWKSPRCRLRVRYPRQMLVLPLRGAFGQTVLLTPKLREQSGPWRGSVPTASDGDAALMQARLC